MDKVYIDRPSACASGWCFYITIAVYGYLWRLSDLKRLQIERIAA
ncbi:hypothetical protein V22_41590 [Calycomorphotria hydatis]|uniref:Uncharacterized protein n=1 Tax=Calycomorphotria hydatis TaxID=2528027 RepID=A0A517TEU3_9PLAN|nr:hypothetical protein V22_41590 [Calycomorphotria hydatis]